VSAAPPLSVCCLTGDEPAMVAAGLRTLRGVADEILVAVDSRVAPERLGPLLEVADRLLRFDFVDPPERFRPWLVAECRHDLVLMLDGDEVPSAALLAALGDLGADTSVDQFRLPRRWCFPDVRHWLAERPWWPDYQPGRLVRRGPDLDFDVVMHGGVKRALPARYLDEPIYHLACTLVPFAERRRRAQRYEAARPGLTAVGGGPMNDTLYVPEHFATLRPEPVPDEDVPVLCSVVKAARPAPDPGGPTPDIPVVPDGEIAAHLPPDPLAPQGYRARLRVAETDRRTAPGNDTTLLVEVANTGAAPLPHRDGRGLQLRVAVRLVDRASGAPLDDWAMTPLPCDVPPGESRLMEAVVRVPGAPGHHTVEVDLINERTRWFGCVAHSDLIVATRWGRHAATM
jgi:hypothetical protein